MTRGHTHTALLAAISQALIAQHPEAKNEGGDAALCIPLLGHPNGSGITHPLGHIIVDVSALAEACLPLISPAGLAAAREALVQMHTWICEETRQPSRIAWSREAVTATATDAISHDAPEAAKKRVAALEEWVIMGVDGIRLAAETARLNGDGYAAAAFSTMALCVQMGSGVQMPAPKVPGQ